MPCVLSDHNYCIEVVVWSSCIWTNYVQRFHNGSRAESYCSCFKCADSGYEWTETIQVEKHVENIEVDLKLEWTWCVENDEIWAGLHEFDSRLTSSRWRAFFTISASALSSSSRSFFLIWSDLRPTTNWSLSRLLSWSPNPQSMEEWRSSARYSSTDCPSCWTIASKRTRDASFETFLS